MPSRKADQCAHIIDSAIARTKGTRGERCGRGAGHGGGHRSETVMARSRRHHREKRGDASRAASRAWYHRHKEDQKRAQAQYRADPANRARTIERMRARYAANRERERAAARERNRTSSHGLTREQRDELYVTQGRACAGCRRSMPNDDLQVDHDHACCPGRWSCGRCVRGLVCPSCNSRDVLGVA